MSSTQQLPNKDEISELKITQQSIADKKKKLDETETIIVEKFNKND